MATWVEDDPDDVVVLPAPLGGRVALDALHRLQDELTPTQSRTHPSAAELPRLFGPDGCFEHRPLRLVEVAPHDLAMLTAAAAQLGHALALAPGSELADAIEAGAEAAYPTRSPDPSTGVELVETFARVNGLLDLATTADTEMLTRRLWADGCSDIVLTIDEEIAYTRLAHRFSVKSSVSGLELALGSSSRASPGRRSWRRLRPTRGLLGECATPPSGA